MTSPDLTPTNPPATSFVVGPGAQVVESTETTFNDRRSSQQPDDSSERRQFGSTHSGLSEAGRELALAIDQYKLEHHRRYITCDEMLAVVTSLGYSRDE